MLGFDHAGIWEATASSGIQRCGLQDDRFPHSIWTDLTGQTQISTLFHICNLMVTSIVSDRTLLGPGIPLSALYEFASGCVMSTWFKA